MTKSNNPIKFLVVGSRAMNQRLQPALTVNTKDTDVVFAEDDLDLSDTYMALDTDQIEFHKLPQHIFDQMCFKSTPFPHNPTIATPTLETLWVLKLSHAEYNIHWHKTVSHVQIMKKQLKDFYWKDFRFHDLPENYQHLFQDLKAYWKTIHGKRKEQINLAVSKEQFFTNNVPRIYEHDQIHEYMKYGKKPLYQTVLKNNTTVMLDQNKFNRLAIDDAIKLAREEIYVIALERYLLPVNFKTCAVRAYQRAVRKVVIELSKGWFSDFIVENYDKLYKMDIDYVARFKERSGYNAI